MQFKLTKFILLLPIFFLLYSCFILSDCETGYLRSIDIKNVGTFYIYEYGCGATTETTIAISQKVKFNTQDAIYIYTIHDNSTRTIEEIINSFNLSYNEGLIVKPPNDVIQFK